MSPFLVMFIINLFLAAAAAAYKYYQYSYVVKNKLLELRKEFDKGNDYNAEDFFDHHNKDILLAMSIVIALLSTITNALKAPTFVVYFLLIISTFLSFNFIGALIENKKNKAITQKISSFGPSLYLLAKEKLQISSFLNKVATASERIESDGSMNIYYENEKLTIGEDDTEILESQWQKLSDEIYYFPSFPLIRLNEKELIIFCYFNSKNMHLYMHNKVTGKDAEQWVDYTELEADLKYKFITEAIEKMLSLSDRATGEGDEIDFMSSFLEQKKSESLAKEKEDKEKKIMELMTDPDLRDKMHELFEKQKNYDQLVNISFPQ